MIYDTEFRSYISNEMMCEVWKETNYRVLNYIRKEMNYNIEVEIRHELWDDVSVELCRNIAGIP